MAGVAIGPWRPDTSRATAAARDEFPESVIATLATAPGSQIVGSSPVLVEPCEIVAVAEGGAGFMATPVPADS